MESGTIDPMKIEAEAFLPTEYGNFKIRVMVDENGSEHSILSVGLEQTNRRGDPFLCFADLRL